MEPAQVSTARTRFGLRTERIGPLPLLNHFIERLGLPDLFARHVPTDRRHALSHARSRSCAAATPRFAFPFPTAA